MNPLSRPEGDSSPERGSFGGRKEVKRMADEKAPALPVKGRAGTTTNLEFTDTRTGTGHWKQHSFCGRFCRHGWRQEIWLRLTAPTTSSFPA